LHDQLARDSPRGTTSNSNMSKLLYYRHIYYTVALMCANNRIIIFCSLLDIQENIVYGLVFGPPCMWLMCSCWNENIWFL